MTAIDADYVVVGAGAMGMAFVDEKALERFIADESGA